ncbi:MAG: class I SAM-dependent methyltransferase [Chloroflexi bacterium]|nr:class I SAM-dependent methyltransferase [Chloroflexota bacterium]
MASFVRQCPVCRGKITRALYRPRLSPGAVARCTRCAMVYVQTIEDDHALIFDGPVLYDGVDRATLTSSNLETVKGSWEFAHLAEKEAEQPCLRLNALHTLAMIESHLTAAGVPRIFDYGAGFGFFLAAAKEKGWEASGLEPLPATAVYARAKFGLNILTDTLHAGSYPPAAFDVITAFQVFEHIPNPDESLGYLVAMLKPGGLIVVEIPNFDTWSVRLLRSRHRHFVQDHLNFFTKDTLGNLFARHGLATVASYRPRRWMSVAHFYGYWMEQKLPNRICPWGEKLLQRLGVWNKNIAVDFGDMLTMIARKPPVSAAC